MSAPKLAPFDRDRSRGLSARPFPELTAFESLRPLAPNLPAELIPRTLRDWICDISDRMQTPLEMVAVPALVAIAGVVGRRIGIHPKAFDDWFVVPNLWGGVVARPGKMKSPVLAEALAPLRRLAEKAQETHPMAQDVAAARIASLKAKEAAIKEKLKKAHRQPGKVELTDLEEKLVQISQEMREQEQSSQEKRYIVNDTTIEKLGELLKSNPLGLLLERDELAGWLRALERDDRRGDREFFLEAWNGTNPYTYDRIGRGTVHVPAICLSIIGGIQPTKLARFVSEALDGGYAADGLLQRFQLLVWPEHSDSWTLVDRQPDAVARRAVFDLFRRLDAMPGPSRGESITALRFATDAQSLFFDWLQQLEERIRSDALVETPAFESHLAKYRSLMPSLSLLFHLIEETPGEPVSLDAAKLGANWCEFLDQHAQKVYAAELHPGSVAAHALAEKIRKGAIVSGMTVREVYTAGWSKLKTPEHVHAGIGVLDRHGWARVEVKDTGGRPKSLLAINPLALETSR